MRGKKNLALGGGIGFALNSTQAGLRCHAGIIMGRTCARKSVMHMLHDHYVCWMRKFAKLIDRQQLTFLRKYELERSSN